MIDYDSSYLNAYTLHRPNSYHVIHDASTIDYKNLFKLHNVPLLIDYLQIDLEASNGSTLNTLKNLDLNIFKTYKFAVVTFGHDAYYTDFDNTRITSRDIFKNNGYVCVFEDVANDGNPYEDWYVHPDLVDMTYVNSLIENNKHRYTTHHITGKTICWRSIDYMCNSSVSNGIGRMCNQIVEHSCMSMISKKYDLRTEYKCDMSKEITDLGFIFYSGKNTFSNLVNVSDDDHFINIYNQHSINYNINLHTYCQSKECSNLFYKYVQRELKDAIKSKNPFKTRYKRYTCKLSRC